MAGSSLAVFTAYQHNSEGKVIGIPRSCMLACSPPLRLLVFLRACDYLMKRRLVVAQACMGAPSCVALQYVLTHVAVVRSKLPFCSLVELPLPHALNTGRAVEIQIPTAAT